jgi:hypothetical protein
MPNFEEGGLSKQEFAAAQAKLEKKVASNAGQERERELKLYFEFDCPETRDKALRALNELRDKAHEHDDRFHFFVSCGVDPRRPDVGMEICFLKSPPNLRRDFEQLLTEQGLMPKEEYETVGGEPCPEETKINT